MEIRIYVGNLAKSTTQDEITALFAQEGEVTSVELVKDRNSGLSKGFAFVAMTSQESADKAISKYNGYSLAGDELKVHIATPRKRAALPGLSARPAGDSSSPKGPARRLSFSELLGCRRLSSRFRRSGH